MDRSRQSNGWVRFVQRLADLAAVAQARYGARLAAQKHESGRTVPIAAGGRLPPAAIRLQRVDHNTDTPVGSGQAAIDTDISPGRRPAGEGPGHQESREKIRVPDAPPAPPEPTSLPEACRDHVLPRGALATIKELFRRFGKDLCPTFAAALAFFGILSIIPMLVVALAALAFVFQDPGEAMRGLHRVIAGILPGSTASQTAREIMEQANVESSVQTLIETRGIAGLIGLLSLIWASMQIFVNAAPAVNAAYEVQETRSWIRLRLLALGLLIGAGVLFLLSLLPSSGPEFISNLNLPWLGLPEPTPWWIDLLFALVALAINVSMFALIYKFLPNAPTTWRQAFVGGLVAGVLWEGAKKAFAYYLANFGNYDKVYGTLGGLIVLVLWIYYTAMILLLGAEASSLYRDLKEATPAEGREAVPRQAAPASSRPRARA